MRNTYRLKEFEDVLQEETIDLNRLRCLSFNGNDKKWVESARYKGVLKDCNV